MACAAAALLRPLLLSRGVPFAAALLAPGAARTARLWAHLLPIYGRYRLAGWRAGRAGRAARARALRGVGPGAPAGAGDVAEAGAAASEAVWARTHEAGGAAVHAMVLDLSVRSPRLRMLRRCPLLTQHASLLLGVLCEDGADLGK